MKRNAIFRIIAWTISLVILVGVLVAGMNWFRPKANPGFWHESTAGVPLAPQNSGNTYSLTAKDIRDVEIDWLSGNIEIIPADVADIQITESPVMDSPYAMVCKQEGQTLKIAFCEPTIFGSLKKGANSKDLTITVPKVWDCRSLGVDAASSKLFVQDMTIREVDLDTASGASRFEGCTVDALDIDTASGDVYFEGSLKKLDCDSASAGVQAVLDNVPYEIDIDTASGSLELFLPEDAGFSVKMDTMSGKFDSTLSYTAKNGRYIRGNGACDIDVSSMSGNVTIRSK